MEDKRTSGKRDPPAASEKKPGKITAEELKALGFKEHPPTGKGLVIGMPGLAESRRRKTDSTSKG